MAKSDKRGWAAVSAGIFILLCLGVAYSWGVFLVPIDRDLGWGRAKISLAVSILLLVFSAFMVVGGLCEKKFGPRKTASLGGVLVALGWILASLAKSPLWLYMFYGIVAGIGTGLSYMPSISCGMRWFPKHKGLITGIIVFGFGFGAAFFSPLITHLIDRLGWRAAMIICGLCFGAIITLAAQFLKIPQNLENSQEHAASPDDGNNFSSLEMIKTSAFKVMFITYALAMVAGMMTIGHISAFTLDKNFAPMQAALTITILAMLNGAGRIFFGWLSDRMGRKQTLAMLFGVIGVMMLLLNSADELAAIYIFAAVIGLCFGGFLAVYPPLTADYFGVKNFAVNYGLVFIGYGSGCFLGPLVAGIIYESTKGYALAFNIAGVLALGGGVLTLSALKKPLTAISK